MTAAAVVELAAKAADLHVNGPVEGIGIRAPGEFQQLVAGQHPLRPLDEGAEQRKLAARQVDDHAGGRAQLAAHQVEAPAGELAAGADAGRVRALFGAAQHGAHAGQQFAGIAGFSQVIVGAQLQAHDAVGVLAHGRQHDDRRAALAVGKAPAYGQPVLARQHHVEHDQVDGAALQSQLHLRGVTGGVDLVPVLAQEVGDDVADSGVVIDHQDAGARVVHV